MTHPLDVLAQQIAEAWQELLLARADWAHSPNAESIQVEEYAEHRINRLLDRLFDSMTVKQRAAAEVRGIRQPAPAA